MREETPPEPICTYCKCSITNKQWPYKTLSSGEKAHLACYLEHMEDDERNPRPDEHAWGLTGSTSVMAIFRQQPA